ncbi:hypothetical protein F0562_010309 [Nyssa sinensis]|uniref:Pentacotripeptide-repeat region of PRORP domain-containing protein n=1 Tax=Nyssa sinensis TaxID=561372 RepID=A0A5J5A1F9_9ASTE|nr:hypothetical protein F0562_010309 [Nyssa sinensis]
MAIRSSSKSRLGTDVQRYFHFVDRILISEWMSSKGLCSFSPGDHAVQLDLIGKVHGLTAAESYFNNTSDQAKIDKTYGALLNCYVREGLVDKSLSHMQQMKEMGFASSSLSYNDIMCLYTRTGQLEKVPDVLSEMKKNGVSPDNFSYRICINSYGTRSDLNSMEKLLEEMESEPHISMDWTTYSTVANFYVKAGFNKKALTFLKKLEENVCKDALGYNHLISLHASLGRKDEVMRLWGLQKVTCKKQINRDYITMLGSLVKLGELEETEAFLKEWESSCQCYDFRVPNVLLIGYCQKGLIEKAEVLLQDIIKRGKTPIPNSWAILASAYLDKQNMEKALHCMKQALAVQAENPGWRPKPSLISSISDWLGDKGEVEEVEAFVSSLKMKVPMNEEMYHALIQANIRGRKEVDWILESMKADNIDEDEEKEKILRES